MKLSRTDQSVYTTIDFDSSAGCFVQRWYGQVSLGLAMEGVLKLVDMLRQQPTTKVLSDARALQGALPKDVEDWIAQVGTPMLVHCGMQYLAQLIPEDVFAELTTGQVLQRISEHFTIQQFDNEPAARAWLATLR